MQQFIEFKNYIERPYALKFAQLIPDI